MSQGMVFQPTDAKGRALLDADGNVIPGHGYLCAEVGRASGIRSRGWFNVATGWIPEGSTGKIRVWFMGTKDGKPEYLFKEERPLPNNTRHGWALPDGTDQIGFEFTVPNPLIPLGYEVVLEAR